MAMPLKRNLFLAKVENRPSGNEDFDAGTISTPVIISVNRVFDLQAGIHFQENRIPQSSD